MSEKLTLEEARAIVKRAVEKSLEVQWISAYVVVDEGGNLMSVSRVDGAPAAAVDIARSKAYIAAVTCRNTMAFADRMGAHPVRFAGFQSVLPQPLFPGPGGVAIVKQGAVVGGFASSLSSNKGGMKINIDGKKLSREDVVTAHALQVPYEEFHEGTP
jgi:glc operon protein GlcG